MSWILFALLPLGTLAIALLNLATWRRGDPHAPTYGSLSILIPARNEEQHIAQALFSIQRTVPEAVLREILVYDDKSTDSTRRIVQTLMQKDPRIRLLEGVPLPDGWIGKPHALSRLAEAAQGDMLLFMDADVELKHGGVARLLSLAAAPVSGGVITAMPEQLTGSFVERLVLPLLPLTYLAWLPLRLVEVGKNPKTVAANGQLLAISSRDYKLLGGFATVRNQIVDDVAFCRHAKRNGLKVVFADGTLMARCRMYSGARQTIEGFSKNLYEGVGGRAGTLSAIVLYVWTFLLPYAGLATALVSPERAASALLPSTVGAFSILALQMILVARYRQSIAGLLLHPLSIVAFVCIALNSWKWNARDKVSWAGRSYASMERRFQRSNEGAAGPFGAGALDEGGK